jgi:hypothetical protein
MTILEKIEGALFRPKGMTMQAKDPKSKTNVVLC